MFITELWPHAVIITLVIVFMWWIFRIDEKTLQFLRKPILDVVLVAADFIHDRHLDEFRHYYRQRVLREIRKMKFFDGGIKK